jgi:glycosyltransferase involved in cell wall biosynthesis
MNGDSMIYKTVGEGKNDHKIENIGFVSTRFQGTDGVSMEAEKWSKVMKRMGYECFYFAQKQRVMIAPEAHFEDPIIKRVQKSCFKVYKRTSHVTGTIHSVRKVIKDALYKFVKKFNIDLIVAENCLAIPMNIPLGLALTEFIAETGIPTIAHHHDFYWERPRFYVNAVSDLLRMAFPPSLPSIQHVVINTEAERELSYRTGLSSFVIPNVLDFKKKPPGINHYNSDVRKSLGLEDGDIFILQPTRVVARKGIEHTIEVISRLKNPRAKLVITHPTGDEGDAYEKRIKDYAKHLNVDLIIKPEIIGDKRGRSAKGQKIYTLWDVYPHADLIAYPSTYEGFGNAFIEAIYFNKPILVNMYSSYVMDIKPYRFDVLEMEGYVTDDLIKKIDDLLEKGPMAYEKQAQHNFDLAARYFSYEVLRRKLRSILVNFEGIVEVIEPNNERHTRERPQ